MTRPRNATPRTASTRRRRTAATAATAAILAAVVAVPSGAYASGGFVAGSSGTGDPFFPLAGNGGYDVSHYSLNLNYQPSSKRLTGTTTISATATENLYRFDLDLRGFDISRLTVDGRAASWRHEGQELIITPHNKLHRGQHFTVTVGYAGVPQAVTDPDGSTEGWVATDDGAVVADEPQGAPSWYPVNDNPADKATFDFSVSVPSGLTAMANGVLTGEHTSHGTSTFTWRENLPMAPYLATATVGKFDLTTSKVDGRLPSYVAVDPSLTASRAVLDKIPSIINYFSSIYGPYPFDAVGAIVDNAPDLGYSLETQTKPVFAGMPGESTLAHELAHQWYGDTVTVKTWPDIWLHEGFATWSEWIWSEHEGGTTAAQQFASLYSRPATSSLWAFPVANPGEAPNLFGTPVYDRGAMVLEALREKIGDTAFFRIMRDWIVQHRYGNATTADFTKLAERDSHQNLKNFFNVWLYQAGKPTSW
ncbi:M1 family metallopeptidase [Rugosimonospora acidiphila]|uniref:Aminopeptidase N n=1 Tax=Rugosimonospora acidiphila TaxID=556531 RepID=A0ABP9SP57_9ACTN